ncbi:uncharacterized protein [Triticum aestivum]|uniref:uncharacterized protein n=1 Tax=Triticum aestivum TaxID=4565 RepID=UPI001D018C36|nr:uncharacterized protein LOC123155585 [Triticum aestivum]
MPRLLPPSPPPRGRLEEAGASFLGLQLSPLLLQIAAQVEQEATIDFILWPVVDNRCMVGRTMAKRGRTEGSGFRVGRRGRHCLYLSASCNHLLVASDNDFRWRGPYKWHAREPPLPMFGLVTIIKSFFALLN